MANGIGCDTLPLGDRRSTLWGAMASLPSGVVRSPRAGGRKSLAPQDVAAMLILGNVFTQCTNGADPLLSRAAAAAASPIRSAAGLLRRGPAVGGRRPPLRVHPRRLSGAVPRLPPRPAPRLLRRRPARAPGADQEGSRPPDDHRPAQAEPVDL